MLVTIDIRHLRPFALLAQGLQRHVAVDNPALGKIRARPLAQIGGRYINARRLRGDRDEQGATDEHDAGERIPHSCRTPVDDS